MGDKNARSGRKSPQEALETFELGGADAAPRTPGPAGAGEGIDRQQPGRAGLLGEGIGLAIDAFAVLPGSENPLEESGGRNRPRAIIMIARDRQAGDGGALHAQKFRCPAHFRLETQGGGVAGEDNVVGAEPATPPPWVSSRK